MGLKTILFKLFFWLDHHDTLIPMTLTAFFTGASMLGIGAFFVYLFTVFPDFLGPFLIAIALIFTAIILGYIILGMLYDINRSSYIDWKFKQGKV